MAGYRIDRVSEDISREITAVIRELKDPRVQGCLLTVVRVEVNSDASFAKVYISAMEGLDAAKKRRSGLKERNGIYPPPCRRQSPSAQNAGAEIYRGRFGGSRHKHSRKAQRA